MTVIRKVCVVTGARAEYSLLYWLMRDIQASRILKLQLVVTGMHLSPEYGLTYQQIERDGFTIDRKVEMLLSSDSDIGIAKSMGIGMIGFADVLIELKPDILVLLGDRFEIFAAASAAYVAKVPIAHLHGGETTEGAFDEAFRHSITKMASIHFTSTEAYRKRVIQLGEQPERVFNVGAIGVDNIKRLKLFSKTELEKELNLKFNEKNLLITFHPVTLEFSTTEEQFATLLKVLDNLKDTNLIFTKANADTGGRIINRMIDSYVVLNSKKSIAFTSMGQLKYLSIMQFVDGLIGNSSSGLLEAPSLKVGAINIGNRQLGRIRAESVIDCAPTIEGISSAIGTLYSRRFLEKLKTVKNPYGKGSTSEKIINILQKPEKFFRLKKSFYNLCS